MADSAIAIASAAIGRVEAAYVIVGIGMAGIRRLDTRPAMVPTGPRLRLAGCLRRLERVFLRAGAARQSQPDVEAMTPVPDRAAGNVQEGVAAVAERRTRVPGPLTRAECLDGNDATVPNPEK
jgi:hypothetical protein